MIARKLPDYRLKQKILYIDKTSPESLISYGDMYLEAGALSDALDFYARASHTAGIEKIRKQALEIGDVFLFQGAVRALGLELRDEDWENIAQTAVRLKKFSFAVQASKKIGDAGRVNALTTMIKAEEAKQSA
ncbi:MAG: hypothetical protein PHQ63_02105 [Smithellaceae bacterium]|nr:hypothetical protein [Smithellaceae bacterium]